MSDLKITGGGETLTLDDLTLAFRLGLADRLLEGLLARVVSAREAERRGVAVTVTDLDDRIAEYFAELDLLEEDQVTGWLGNRGVTLDEVRENIRIAMLGERLRAALAPDAEIRRRFVSSMHDYTEFSMERIDVEDEGAANEFTLALREGELSWADAVERADTAESLDIRAADLPEDLRGPALAAAEGAMLGPIETDAGGFAIYRLAGRRVPELDEDLTASIREEIYREFLAREFARAPLRILGES